MKLYLVISTLLLTCICHGQNFSNKERRQLGERFARGKVEEALKENNPSIKYENQKPVLDSLLAYITAETILFKHYGQETILSQKPFAVYSVDNYWFYAGQWANRKSFILILDKRSGKIIKMEMRNRE